MYEPREDSYFLKEVCEKEGFGKVLDMGCGTGIIGISMLKSKKVKEVHFSDINEDAINFVERTLKKKNTKKKTKVILSNLFEKINEKYHTIAFNPPYLPGNYEEDIEIYGGKKGNEIILKFLDESVNYIYNNGKIILLFSELSRPNEILNHIKKLMLEIKRHHTKQVFFEKLHVLVLSKSKTRIEIEKQYTNLRFYDEGWRNYIYLGKDKITKQEVVIKINKYNNPEEIEKEYKILKELQKYDFVPRVYKKSKTWFSMEFIKGESFNKVLSKIPKQDFKGIEKIKEYLIQIIKIANILDKEGIKKEEFNRPYKNVIIKDKKIYLIDFDKSKKGKGNVNELMSFIMTHFPNFIKCNKEEIIKKLREYKNNLDLNSLKSCLNLEF